MHKLKRLSLDGLSALRNLDGLKGLSGLETINISQCGSIENLDVLKWLQNIIMISIEDCGSLENVDALDGMENLVLKRDSGLIDLCGCNSLKDLKGLKNLKGITSLRMHNSSFENLDIFSEMTHLKKIGLRKSRQSSTKVKDISGLKNLAGLVELNLEGAGDLETLDGLEGCKSLKKIILISCKKLKNVDALLELPALAHIFLRGSGIKRDKCPVQLLDIADWQESNIR
ncbi:Internalin I [subsurface metagenome]